MPNAFQGTVGSPGNPQTVTVPLFDPRWVRAERSRFRRDAFPELGYANSFYTPSGRWPSRGWILLKRSDYNLFTNLFRTDFKLLLQNMVRASPSLAAVVPAQLTLQGLAIVQARCVTRGLTSNPNAVYLVEITDHQGVLANPWGQWPTNSQYNVLAPAYPGGIYQLSTNAGVSWTWDTMVNDLWTQMPLLGPYPGLPIVPPGTPENYVFAGEGCWDALNHVLDHLGLTITEDLTQANPYGIAVPGATDANFTAQTAKFAGLLEQDFEYIDAGAARAPGLTTVYFHRVNQYYGTEETVRGDALQWQSTPLYSVTKSAPAPFASSPGKASIWSDFSVRFDVDGNPLAADMAMADTIASSLVTAYYNRITRGTIGYMRRVYTGALPFTAGSQVDGVRWYQTDGRAAWRTELMRGPQPPWPELHVDIAGRL